MSHAAITVDQLGKQYRIGAKYERYQSLRDVVSRTVAAPFKRLSAVARGEASVPSERTIWALKDINFEIQPGEVVGIIGRNGAGKSTILKILSRITPPTVGEVVIHGRVGSLLEVGTGFHPELSGRENIFLNGAILGMSRREILQKFDEIVAFAELDIFIDTMVKHYSSGMYMRLAFAVAAHLNPEILLVDEVLAVGDLEFQKKCIGKMEDVGKLGRTVIFVSHNISAITRLCTRAILMHQGRLVTAGPTASVVAEYVFAGHGTRAERRWDPENAPTDTSVRLLSVRARNEAGQVLDSFDIRQAIAIDIEYEVLRPNLRFTPCFDIVNETGLVLFLSHESPNWQDVVRPMGRYTSTCTIPGNFLAEGTFHFDIAFWGFGTPPSGRIEENGVIALSVHDPLEGGSARGKGTTSWPGVIRPLLNWSVA